MKKLLPVCIIGILLLSGVGIVARTNTMSKGLNIKTDSFALSEPVLTEKGVYMTIGIEEATSSLMDPGKPMLPVFTKVYTYPFNTTIIHVEVSFSKTNEIHLSKDIIPATEPTPFSGNVADEPIKDPKIYGNSALYPTEHYHYVVGAGLDHGEHIIFLVVQCYPVRYSPAQNILYFSEQIEIQITYEEPAMSPVFSDAYDLVIISPSKYSEALQPLIDHKNQMGLNTTLKTTEDIYANYTGFDNAEKIKYFIKDAIETWGVDYVLLVGGIKALPIRTTWFFEQHWGHYWNQTVLTDLYYADIYDSEKNFSSWDSNGNGLYGEIYEDCPGVDDICDFYPDVYLGRLPCVRTTEVKTVVSKIIHYETETAGQSWFHNIILVGGDTFLGRNGYEGEQKNLLTEEIMENFTAKRLWTSDGTFTARALNQAINQGAGFVDYAGHGFEIGLGTHPPDSNIWVTYHTNKLVGAFNGDKLPIIFFDACLTAKLDFNISDLVGYVSEGLRLVLNKFHVLASLPLPTFAWCMVKKSNGGAIATIGATRTAFGGTDMGCGYLSLRFYEAYATSETVSQMLTQAQNHYITFVPFDRFTLEEFILIGDPSLRIGGYD
ncbi:hypothetical protein AYK25_09790 [Thermoplasmatales archaeon SM1-50]|nr:MAG: hypothetical protein AYK25_09790 [Thermoplasmatales archaeon SM1-50]